MSNTKLIQLIIFVMLAVSFLFPFLGQTSVKKTKHPQRPDFIDMQMKFESGENEMPAAVFLHDLHTEAVDEKCTECHIEKEGRTGFVFKGADRLKTRDKKEGMDFFHNNCISCHVEKKAANKKTGPDSIQCGVCHIEEKTRTSSREKINFDRSLHFVHEQAESIKGKEASDKENCSACHHSYNEKTEKIFYDTGREEACSYCHKPEKQEKIRSVRQASHDSCVKCHYALKTEKIAAGPVTCKGCHDKKEHKKIQKVTDIPRLKRNQPDSVVITPWDLQGTLEESHMNPVVFNHKRHESNTQTCKACHHKTLQKKCSDCHTIDGGESTGGFISLAQAMHDSDNTKSCIGCHREFTKSTDCAGCHVQAPVKKDDSSTCKTCHNLQPEQLKNIESAEVSEKILAEGFSDYIMVQKDKIPEEVVIDELSDEYKPSRLPHKKMVEAIFERVEKSSLANAFHKSQADLCMGCHHNSPKSLKPPKCASCHNKKGPGPDGRPGLKGAFHGQCMTCHDKMQVKSVPATDCAKCHEKKKRES